MSGDRRVLGMSVLIYEGVDVRQKPFYRVVVAHSEGNKQDFIDEFCVRIFQRNLHVLFTELLQGNEESAVCNEVRECNEGESGEKVKSEGRI